MKSKTTKKKIEKTKIEMTEAEKSACMPYLHGVINDAELEAARIYEYARESNVLRRAAEMYQSGKRQHDLWLPLEKETGQTWFLQASWYAIYEHRAFPAKAWSQLSQVERTEFRSAAGFGPPPSAISPLRMSEVWQLEAMGVFDEFKRMAKEQMKEKERTACQAPGSPPKPQRIILPLIEGSPRQGGESSQWAHALFTIDFGKTRERLLDELKAWLDLPENKKRFEKYGQKPMGKTDKWKDALKYVAIWRLIDWLGVNGAAEYATKNQLKADDGKPLRFHGAPTGQTEPYSEQSAWQRARRSALAYRARLLPWEFGTYAEERKQREEEFKQYWQSKFHIVPSAKKTSKKTS